MPTAVLKQPVLIGVAARVIFGRQCDAPGPAALFLLLQCEPGPHKVLSEVGCRGHADEGVNALGSRKRRKQHHPAAHARADDDLPTFSERIENRYRIIGPTADRPQGDVTARSAVSEIIEAHEGVSAAPAIPLEERGFGSGHIRPEASTK